MAEEERLLPPDLNEYRRYWAFDTPHDYALSPLAVRGLLSRGILGSATCLALAGAW